MTLDQLRQKFFEQVQPVKGQDRANRLVERLTGLLDAVDVSSIFDM